MQTLRSDPCDTSFDNSCFQDRRQTPRTPLYGGSFAVLYTESEEGEGEILAQILDISKEGVAFRFFADSPTVSQVRRIDITLPNQGFCLQGLPVQVVNETADCTNGSHCNTSARVRRLGLCFDAMPHHMVQALDALIERFACGRPD
jgi:hypothetical protein